MSSFSFFSDRSSVGPEFARKRATIFLVLTLVFIAIGNTNSEILYSSITIIKHFCGVYLLPPQSLGVGVTWGTYQIAVSKGGMYVVYVGNKYTYKCYNEEKSSLN